MPPDPAPAPATELDPRALSPAEQAFFDSRGAKTEGLADVPAAPGATGAPAAPAAPAAPVAGATGAAPSPAAGEELDEAAEEAAIAAGKPPKRVNYNKWKRTADELATTRTELGKMRDQATRVDERMRLINEALATTPAAAAAAEEEDPAPDPEQDIFGYVRWQGRQMERLNAELGTMRQATQSERQMQESEYLVPIRGQHLCSERTGLCARLRSSDPKQAARARSRRHHEQGGSRSNRGRGRARGRREGQKRRRLAGEADL